MEERDVANKPTKPGRESQVSVAIKSLYEVSGEIGILVEQLETRLEKVIHTESGIPVGAELRKEAEAQAEAEAQVPLSANLREIKFSLKNSKERLNSILNRLEL